MRRQRHRQDGTPHPIETDSDGDGTLDCTACADAGGRRAVGGFGDDLRTELTNALPDTTCDYYQSKQGIYTSFDIQDGNEVECVYNGQTVQIVGGSPRATR